MRWVWMAKDGGGFIGGARQNTHFCHCCRLLRYCGRNHASNHLKTINKRNNVFDRGVLRRPLLEGWKDRENVVRATGGVRRGARVVFTGDVSDRNKVRRDLLLQV